MREEKKRTNKICLFHQHGINLSLTLCFALNYGSEKEDEETTEEKSGMKFYSEWEEKLTNNSGILNGP